MRRWRDFSSVSIVAGCAAAIIAPAAAAQTEGVVRYDIPAQPLESALAQFSIQSRRQIIYDPGIVPARSAPALHGEYEPEQALQILLQDSGLQVQFTHGKTIVLTAPESATISLTRINQRLAQADTPIVSERSRAPAMTATTERASDVVDLEEIVITGTRIRGVASGASSSHSLGRQDFAESGATSVQQLMRTLPQNFTGGTTETGSTLSSSRNGGSGNLSFGSGINLRGLGAASTLVLLNGRRMAPVGQGGFIDVSTIPLSALERIDVLPDGASAIYGSDAVGGVVNLVLRSDYEGMETSVRYGSVTDGGLRELSANQLAGVTWAGGSALINVDYGERDPLLASERDYAGALSRRGVTYLTPNDERKGVLVNARQSLSDALSLSAVGYINSRDAEVASFANTQGRQLSMEGTAEQAGGTLALSWDTASTWTVTLAQTYSRTDNERDTLLGPSAVAPAAPSSASTEQTMSATELEGEGALFAAPGGVVRLAVGVEYRNEELQEIRMPGPVSARSVSDFDRSVSSAYAEWFVPLVGEHNEMALVDRLDFTAAIRYEDYDDVGSSDNWKLGVVWAPVEGFDLRATRGTSFRAPYLYQFQNGLGFAYLFNAPNPAAPGGTTRMAAISQVPALDLGPENAVIWTTGFDVKPSLLGGFRVSATYFDIDYEDRITATALSPTPFGNPSLAGVIALPPDPGILGQIQALPASRIFRIGGAAFQLADVQATFDARTRNQARTELSGIDLVVERSFDASIGRFAVGVNASYLLSFETQQIDTAPSVDIRDTVFNPTDLRARAHVTYNGGGWSLAAFTNYTDGYTDNQAAPFVPVSSWTTVDLSVAYAFEAESGWWSGVTIRANALNAFDADPPKILDRNPAWGNPGFDTENANPLGRMVSLQISKIW